MNDDRSESSLTSMDENTENFSENQNPTRDILTEGFFRLFKPVIDDLDNRIRSTRITQVELNRELDTINENIKGLNFENDPVLHDSFKKLVNVKQKVVVIMNILQNSQERLNALCQQEEGYQKALEAAAQSQNNG